MGNFIADPGTTLLRAARRNGHNAVMTEPTPVAVAPGALARPRRRRPLWRRILRAVVWTGAALAILGAVAYYRATQPDVLRAKLLRALSGIRYARIELSDIRFSPWDGLDVVDLQIALEPHAPLIAAWPSPQPHPMLRVAHLNVQLDLPALLTGETRPTAIHADGATITLIRDAVTGRTNWNFAPAPRKSPAERDTPDYPRLRLDDADVQLYSAERGHLRLVRRWIVDAAGDAESRGSRDGYGVKIEQVGGPGGLTADVPFPPAGQLVTPVALSRAAPSGPTPLATLWIGGGQTLEASLAWINLATLDAVLPPDFAAYKRDAAIGGRAMVETLRIQDGRLEAAEVRLEDLSFVMPVEAAEPGTAAPDHFLAFAGFSGRLTLERDASRLVPENRRTIRNRPAAAPPTPARLRILANGNLGRSACTLTVAADGLLGGLAADSGDTDPPATQPGTKSGAAIAAAATRPSTGDALVNDLAAMRNWQFQSELRIDGFELPTAPEHPAFVESPNLPKALRAFFKDFLPRGKLDVRLTAARSGAPAAADAIPAAAPIHIEADFIARGTSLRYYRFPYDIEDAQGEFRYRNGAVLFEALSGRHGAGRIRVDGRLAHTRGYGALDLTITGHNIALDADLYAALPERYRHLWESAAPIGLADIQATLRREEGSPETGPNEVVVGVDARLLSASLAAGSGQRLRQVDGAITIDRGIVTIHDLHGTLDGADVRLSGTIDGNRRGASDANNLHLEADNIRIERSATIGGDTGAASPSDRLLFAGRGDVSGRIRGSGGMLSRDAQYVVHIRGGELSSFDGGPPWQCGEGLVVMRGDRQEVRSLSGRWGDAWFEGAGILPVAGSGAAATLEIRAGADEMARLAPRLVPSRWRKQADALALTGPGKATIRMSPAPPDPALDSAANPPGQRVDLRIESAACRFAPSPLPLREFRATAAIDGSGFEIEQATGRFGETGEIKLAGRGGWGPAGDSIDMKLEAHDLPFGRELIEGMPEALRRILGRMQPSGQIDVRLEHLRRAAGSNASWEIRGNATVTGAALRLGLPLTACDGTLTGDCTVRADGQVDLAADFTVQRGRLADRPLERVEGQLVREPGERWMQLNDVRGRLCDGEVSGFGQIDPATAEYEISLTLENVRLDQFMPHGNSGRPPDVGAPPNAPPSDQAGRLDGRIFLRGRADDDSTRRGGGELRIRGASILGTPVLKDVAEANRAKTGRTQEAADWIELRFVWEGSDLKFLRVDLQSRDLRLVGEGRWNMDDDSLIMTLVGAHPENWPRVAVLSDLIETAGQELMQYRVTGTKKSPKVTAEPLHNLTDPIRRLIGGR